MFVLKYKYVRYESIGYYIDIQCVTDIASTGTRTRSSNACWCTKGSHILRRACGYNSPRYADNTISPERIQSCITSNLQTSFQLSSDIPSLYWIRSLIVVWLYSTINVINTTGKPVIFGNTIDLSRVYYCLVSESISHFWNNEYN